MSSDEEFWLEMNRKLMNAHMEILSQHYREQWIKSDNYVASKKSLINSLLFDHWIIMYVIMTIIAIVSTLLLTITICYLLEYLFN